jgi:uncharacterized protein
MRRILLILILALACSNTFAADPVAPPPAAEPIKTPVTANGLVAALFTPANANGRLPAIIILGGSEGGMGAPTARDGRVIAQHGFAVLQLAYFDMPGLPKDLALIPLEYFKTAIDWLRAQPNIDPERIGIVGTSIGGMVALEVAATYSEIKVVVAAVPASVVWAGIIHTEGEPPSTFSLNGKPVPYLPFGQPFTTVYNLYADGLKALDAHPDAIIAVEKINGPVLLLCGKEDKVWPSCPMARLVDARFAAKNFQHPSMLVEYPDAGHFVFGQPLEPGTPAYQRLGKQGGTAEGEQAARVDSWRRVMELLEGVLKQ